MLFYCLLHPVFVGLDHLLDHLTADAAGLAGSKIAVVTLLQIDADFSGGPASILKCPSFAVKRAAWR